MGASSGQQTSWIHLGDLIIAVVFPAPLLQADACESEEGDCAL